MDVSKHSMIFDPSKVNGRIVVAGLGSIGSAVAIQLIKLGLGDRLIVVDPDVVENHNLANQIAYEDSDIESFKASAIRNKAEFLYGAAGTVSHKDFLKSEHMKDAKYLFVCVDSMSARKDIFEQCVWMNPQLEFMSDGRMGARLGTVFAFNPSDLPKAKAYKKLWYPDSDVEDERVGGCSITPSILPTALIVASTMVWSFMNYINGGVGEDETPPFEHIAFRTDTLEMHSQSYL